MQESWDIGDVPTVGPLAKSGFIYKKDTLTFQDKLKKQMGPKQMNIKKQETDWSKKQTEQTRNSVLTSYSLNKCGYQTFFVVLNKIAGMSNIPEYCRKKLFWTVFRQPGL